MGRTWPPYANVAPPALPLRHKSTPSTPHSPCKKTWTVLLAWAGCAPASATSAQACLDTAQLRAYRKVQGQHLSGGLKRRLNLAIALLHEPELILFDEPTVGVDPQSRAFCWMPCKPWRARARQ